MKFGVNDVELLLENSGDSVIAERILSDGKVEQTMKRTADELCENENGKACFWLAQKTIENDVKIKLLTKSCDAGYKKGCDGIVYLEEIVKKQKKRF